MSDKLNETFQKHLKLLHKKLNINEAYGDAASVNHALNARTVRPDWDPDGVTGIRQREAEPYRQTISDYAKKVDWDDVTLSYYLYWLNNVWNNGRGSGWTGGSTYNGTGDSHEFHNWMKREQEKHTSEKKEKREKEIENKSESLKVVMGSLIKTIGVFRWQKYKRMSDEEKISELTQQINTEQAQKKIGDLHNYEELKKYLEDAEHFSFDKHNKKLATDIIISTIEKAEKWLGRGFFEENSEI